MHLIQIPPGYIEQTWPVAAHFLKDAVEKTRGDMTLDATKAHILAGSKQLWVIVTQEEGHPHKVIAAAISSLLLQESGKKTATIELLSGESMKDWFDLKKEFEDWASTENCSEVKMFVRKGLMKHLPDYLATHFILRKQITPAG